MDDLGQPDEEVADDGKPEDSEALNMRIVGVMKQSEQYFENNMNGFCNNISLGSVSAIELGTMMEGFHSDVKETRRVVASAEGHLRFTADRSREMFQRL
jgi:hypothetical protein